MLECESTHLTSFAVLADVYGTFSDDVSGHGGVGGGVLLCIDGLPFMDKPYI